MTSINCKTNRETDPSGLWSYDNLIGSKVKIKSLPVTSWGKNALPSGTICTIDDIVFRVSLDGKTITRIILQEYPDLIITFKDVEVISIGNGEKTNYKIGDNIKITIPKSVGNFSISIQRLAVEVMKINKTDQNSTLVTINNTNDDYWECLVNSRNFTTGNYSIYCMTDDTTFKLKTINMFRNNG